MKRSIRNTGLLLVLFVIAILYRRKSTENARVLKGMQEQMDVLELKVSDCQELEEEDAW